MHDRFFSSDNRKKETICVQLTFECRKSFNSSDFLNIFFDYQLQCNFPSILYHKFIGVSKQIQFYKLFSLFLLNSNFNNFIYCERQFSFPMVANTKEKCIIPYTLSLFLGLYQTLLIKFLRVESFQKVTTRRDRRSKILFPPGVETRYI